MKYKPQLQTKFGSEGNCLSSCFTAFLDVDIDEVPGINSDDFDEWFWDINGWLKEKFGKFVTLIKASDKDHLETVVRFYNGSSIITAISGVEWRHAVITNGMDIVFDPMIGNVLRKLKFEDDPTFFQISDIV